MTPTQKVVAGLIAGGTIAVGGGSVALDNSINPYQSVQVMDAGQPVTALEIATPSATPEAGTDTTIVNTDKPRIELDKWNGEVKLGITSTDLAPTTTGARPFLSKNVDWGSGATTMEAVPIDATTSAEDGGMEININLASEPASNVFTFQLDNWENLDFFYQPPLWQFDGLNSATTTCSDTDCVLPYATMHEEINIVGSYIVYFKNHANHVEGQTNYATGQAFTIYRPLVTDALGGTTWATLLYNDAGTLTVTVPQAFLNQASYPVIVDPTIGYSTVSGNSTTWSVNQTVAANTNTSASVTGPVSMVSMFGHSPGGSSNFKGYMTNTSETILGSIGGATAMTGVDQEWDDSYSGPTLTNGTSYLAWVVFDSTVSTNGTIAACSVLFKTTSYTSPTNPTSPSSSGNCFDIWATYSASGGGSTPAPNVNTIFYQ